METNMAQSIHPQSVIVVGAGIGGLATALALARAGQSVDLLEQSGHIGEIGAGLQLAPNAFAALDALGIGESVRQASVFTEKMVMMDAVDASEVASIPLGEDFRARFRNPYAVVHRADLHNAILEQVKKEAKVRLHTSARAASFELEPGRATVRTDDGRLFTAAAVIGADGVKSALRAHMLGDPPRVSGHVVYRAVVPYERMPADLRINAPVLWAGPNCHLVHYPLRSGNQYNLVVTFHSREQEEWGVTDGSREEVLSYFEGIHARPRQLLDLPDSWRRWATADREPVACWHDEKTRNATLLGDAAHPMMQYLAQGACAALEDAVTLGEALRACDNDWAGAIELYERSRIARSARIVLSVREMGRLYHAKGVERLVRNSLWDGRPPAQFYDALAWLYDWTPANCLAARPAAMKAAA
jgi:salicylate hydroxylase